MSDEGNVPREASYEAVDFAEYVRILWRRRWVVAGVAVVCGALALAYAALSPVTYTTGAELALPEPEERSTRNPTVFSAYVREQADLISSTTVAEEAAAALDDRGGLRSLTDQLEVVVPEDSSVVTVRFRADSARRAQAGAQAFAEAYVATKREESRQTRAAAVQAARARVDTRLEALSGAQQRYDDQCADADGSAVCLRLLNNISQADQAVADAEAEVVSAQQAPLETGRILTAAPVPEGPSSPGPVRTAVLGGLGGLVLGIAAAFVVDRLDPRLREPEDITATLESTSLGSVPTFDEGLTSPPASLVTVHEPEGAEADAFRRLRASVLIALERSGDRVVGVTSATVNEGKSTVAANLAVTISQTGRTVALVAADLRKPSLAALFSIPDHAPGLADVIEGRSTLNQAVVVRSASLGILPASTTVGSAADLLLNRRMTAAITSLRERFDLVVVDTAPLLPVADTHNMGHVLDSVLLVVSVAGPTAEEVGSAEEQLNRLRIPILGSILNRAAPRSADYYAYRDTGRLSG